MNEHSVKIFEIVQFLYPDRQVEKISEDIWQLIKKYQQRMPAPPSRGPEQRLSEKDVILITYGDMVQTEPKKPLAVLGEFLTSHLKDEVNIVHILPFYPYSSDDGFSVIDYLAVDPDLGSWGDIEALCMDFELMADMVANHISQHSTWFQGYLAGDEMYLDYFIEADLAMDLSAVFRPRALPLLTNVETSRGGRWIWTTFSDDQIDLNYKNPAVLLDMMNVLLWYVLHGARCIRLDAIAFIWKEPGTNCLHLPHVHKIVELMRVILDIVAPQVVLITETNVPHRENISYFGDGKHEAQMVYNFSLPPLVLHTIQTGSAEKLTGWAKTLDLPSREVTFFNFLSSHDGVGLLPAKGILDDGEIEALADHTLMMGGRVSYKNNPDGTTSPYEMNINYLDATRPSPAQEPMEKIVGRFLAAQAIMLILRGVPGIYFHSLVGSQNWVEGILMSGQNRRINREKLSLEILSQQLADEQHLRHHVFKRFKKMLKQRRSESSFDPFGSQEILALGNEVFGVYRRSRFSETGVFCLVNVTDDRQTVSCMSSQHEHVRKGTYDDLIGGATLELINETLVVDMQPYQVIWLKHNEQND